MNFLAGLFLIACFLSAVVPFATCESMPNENAVDYHLKQWLQMEAKLYIHTSDHPYGIKFDTKKGMHAIKKEAETKIITHGYQGSKNDLEIIVKEYLKKKPKANVFTYEWKNLAGAGPLEAAMGSIGLGLALAYRITQLISEYKIQPEHIHLIGFNMGAHLMGTAGTYQYKPLGRITGLDPSGEYFNKSSKMRLPALSKKNAKFVDVIHTNAGGLGIEEVIGTIDFFPNGGRVQPKCNKTEDNHCSAASAIEYFAESIKENDSFSGVLCHNYDEFLRNRCKAKRDAVFGEFGDTGKSGMYFFQTNDKSPYGRKKSGEHPQKKQ